MAGVLIFAAAAVVLAAIVAFSARPRAASVLTIDAHLAGWSALHGSVNPAANTLVHRWLRAMYRLAWRPARWGWQPDALSPWGVWAAAGCVVLGAAGGRWPLLGPVFVVLVGFFDGLDGAVAVVSGRASNHGRVVDAVADRAGDVLLLVAFGYLRVPWWLLVLAGATILLLEGTRVVARGLGRITPGERPTRLILAALGLFAAGLVPSRAGTAGGAFVAVLAVLVAVSWVLLLGSFRGSFRARPGRSDSR